MRIQEDINNITMSGSGGGSSQQFCVRWNSHLGSLGAAFPQLLAGQRFVDVTLACEGHQVHCHRLVLAACSSYFEGLLGENPCKHPIIILPRDIKLWEIQALVDFMYKGEVNVSQEGLPDLLKCAEALQIRGLCGSDAALNLNQISTNSVSQNRDKSPAFQANNFIPVSTRRETQANKSVVVSKFSETAKESQQISNEENVLLAKVSTESSLASQSQLDMPKVNLDEGEDSITEMLDDSELQINDDFSENSIVKIEPDQIIDNDNNQEHHSRRSLQCGKIRVKSNENLLENYKSHHPSEYSLLNSTAKKQNKNVNRNIRIKHSSFRGLSTLPSDTEKLPSSLKFNKKSMTIFVTSKSDDDETEFTTISDTCKATTSTNNIENYENIICSPNFIAMPYSDDNGDGFACDDNTEDYDESGIGMDNCFNDSNMESGLMAADEDHDLSILNNDDIVIEDAVIDQKPTFLPPLIPFNGNDNSPQKKPKDMYKEELRKLEKMTFENCLLNGGPPPNSFVLRNPRGNQPRTYNTDALWAALMDVKAGESIYRASQVHKVPRKTLRNWMKRWDIKSSYPMPRQLRQAAEKRKAVTTVLNIKPDGRANDEQQTNLYEQLSLQDVEVINQV